MRQLRGRHRPCRCHLWLAPCCRCGGQSGGKPSAAAPAVSGQLLSSTQLRHGPTRTAAGGCSRQRSHCGTARPAAAQPSQAACWRQQPSTAGHQADCHQRQCCRGHCRCGARPACCACCAAASAGCIRGRDAHHSGTTWCCPAAAGCQASRAQRALRRGARQLSCTTGRRRPAAQQPRWLGRAGAWWADGPHQQQRV